MTKREYGESLTGKQGEPSKHLGQDFILHNIPGTSLTYLHLVSESEEPLSWRNAVNQVEYYENHLRLVDPTRRDKEKWYKVLKLRDDLKELIPTLPRI